MHTLETQAPTCQGTYEETSAAVAGCPRSEDDTTHKFVQLDAEVWMLWTKIRKADLLASRPPAQSRA
jgi:hypothetical protein